MAKRKNVSKKKTSSRKRSSTKKRVSDVPSIAGSDSSINIKKIQNGLIVRISKNTKNNYTEKEYFAKTNAEAKKIVGKAL